MAPRVVGSADSDGTMLWFGTALGVGYFCSYFWRFPVFVVSGIPGVAVGDGKQLSLKTLMALAQILGYLLAKFPAIRVVTAFDRSKRVWLLPVLCASGVLFVPGGFGVLAGVSPWLQVLSVFVGALPGSWLWGVLMTYTEGRRSTEVLNSYMSVLLVFAGGAARAVGAAVAAAPGFDNEYSKTRRSSSAAPRSCRRCCCYGSSTGPRHRRAPTRSCARSASRWTCAALGASSSTSGRASCRSSSGTRR
jgi:Family of unknown function (DUF5690)